jgi:septal ring factor EnvC (AmiA/AmiB activator)
LPEQLVDAEAAEKKDLKQLESSLQSLWEKARLVSDSLLRFKAENRELRNRITSLEVQERHWTEELQRRERDLEEVRKQLTLAQSNGSSLFSKEESEVLKTRLRELITKINSRL